MASDRIILVDSCVLLDIFNDDQNWAQWSSSTLYKLSSDFQLAINVIIFTEIALNFESSNQLVETLDTLSIKILDIPVEPAFNVSRTFKKYKKKKGNKLTPMPDFYIGEHAKYLGATLVTRDTARYKTYQPSLKLITPPVN